MCVYIYTIWIYHLQSVLSLPTLMISTSPILLPEAHKIHHRGAAIEDIIQVEAWKRRTFDFVGADRLDHSPLSLQHPKSVNKSWLVLYDQFGECLMWKFNKKKQLIKIWSRMAREGYLKWGEEASLLNKPVLERTHIGWEPQKCPNGIGPWIYVRYKPLTIYVLHQSHKLGRR